jgi:hypothetical protein
MPTTTGAPAVQADPARPQIALKPHTNPPETESRRPRAPKRPRPSTSQGGAGGGGSDDDSDDDDVVEWAGPSASSAPGGGAGLAGQRK